MESKTDRPKPSICLHPLLPDSIPVNTVLKKAASKQANNNGTEITNLRLFLCHLRKTHRHQPAPHTRAPQPYAPLVSLAALIDDCVPLNAQLQPLALNWIVFGFVYGLILEAEVEFCWGNWSRQTYINSSKGSMCSYRKYPYPPQGRYLEILRGGGLKSQIFLMKSMELNWNSSREGRFKS